MSLKLMCQESYDMGERRGFSERLCVRNERDEVVVEYALMCAAINDDIRSPRGVEIAMEWVHKVESGALDLVDIDGNGWVMNVTREKVWFEGLYSQGEGSEISLSQFKFVVQTYLQFLNDPEHETIEVDFPSS